MKRDLQNGFSINPSAKGEEYRQRCAPREAGTWIQCSSLELLDERVCEQMDGYGLGECNPQYEGNSFLHRLPDAEK